jgi:hypothetical protein
MGENNDDKQGKIMEQDTHDNLLKAGGIYSTMVLYQYSPQKRSMSKMYSYVQWCHVW